jgi:hypothetical protein
MIRATCAVLAILCATTAAASAVEAASSIEEVGRPDSPTEVKPGWEAARRKFGPRDVEIALRDGSRVRGEISGFESVSLKTRYGTLSIPLSEIHDIVHGKRSSDKNAISAALKDLAGSDAAASAKAAKSLQDMGSAVVEMLFDARAKADSPVRERIDAVLKNVLATAEHAKDSRDFLRAAKFTGSGTIDLGEFNLSSKFGDLKLHFDRVESIRWLASGGESTINLDAVEGLRDWTDSGMEVLTGDAVQMSASGKIRVFSYDVTPVGSNNINNSQPFLGGALIGRFGEDGEPFMIGAEKRLSAPASGKLYLRIFLCDELLPRAEVHQATGAFTVRISTRQRVAGQP